MSSTIVFLLMVMLFAPAAAVAAMWLVRPDDKRLADIVFAAIGAWYVAVFCLTGIIYIINTIIEITNNYGA